MALRRHLRHLVGAHWQMHRTFTPAVRAAIEQAIGAAERLHHGEIRFVVEAALDPAALWRGLSPRQRAIELFSDLRVWDTAQNNGVLLYVLWADHAVELVCDRGVAQQAPAAHWEAICRTMETAFRAGDYAGGSIAAVQAVAATLQQLEQRSARNELPNAPLLMR